MSKIRKAIRFTDGTAYPWGPHWADTRQPHEILTGEAADAAVKAHIRRRLLAWIKPGGPALRAVCVKRPRDGMGWHHYRLFVAGLGGTGIPYIQEITLKAAMLTGIRLSKDGALMLGGCGYSKPSHIGYSLGRALWPDGTPEPHGTRNGEPDSDGGYALKVDS